MEEPDSKFIEIYGNVSSETYAEQQKLLYLVNKYEE
jgi:hypothetical protein